jgi:hypothetical protein
MNLTPLLVLLSLLCTTPGCKKKPVNSDHGLPSASHEGRDIFACYRDGLPWISKRGAPSMMGYFRHDSILAHGTVDDGTRIESVDIKLFPANYPVQATYAFNDSLRAYVLYISTGSSNCFSPDGGFGQMAVRKITNGSVTITRADDHVLSGTFDFVVPTDFCDSIRFSSGRFDLRQYDP